MAGLHDANNEASSLTRSVVAGPRDYFGDRVSGFAVQNVQEDDHGRIGFSVIFEAYAYFEIIFNYDRGAFGLGIRMGDRSITALTGSELSFVFDDIPRVASALEERLRLRIPNKYLDQHGW